MFHVALNLRLVDLNYSLECCWLIELSDNKLTNCPIPWQSQEPKDKVLTAIYQKNCKSTGFRKCTKVTVT